MRFLETRLEGSFVIELEPHRDERGFFARTFCAREFAERGLEPGVAQCNLSYNHLRGTLRGLHLQVAPAAETKLVRCVRGAVYDVIVDLRPESATYLSHVGVELTADNRRALYVPKGFAHGYQTLVDDTEVFYQSGEFYSPQNERGIRYDDPALSIQWPVAVTEISLKDASWPLLEAAHPAGGRS